VARPPWDNGGGTRPGFIAVVAPIAGTQLTVTPTAKLRAGTSVPEVAAKSPYSTTLAAGEVIELFSYDGDLTGSLVEADQPISVISGHYCANPIGDTSGACQHQEEQIPPVERLDTSWFVVPPISPYSGWIRPETVRIVATEPSTQLWYDPPEPGAPTALASAGDFVELAPRTTALAIGASAPVLVVESMHLDNSSIGPIGGPGNHAMSVAISEQAMLDDLSFAHSAALEQAWAHVVAPLSGAVALDGVSLTGFTPIGSSGYGFLRVPLSNAPGVTRRLLGGPAFGASAYSYAVPHGASVWQPLAL
jgi:hypothetical protein